MDIHAATADEAVDISELRLGDRVGPGPRGPWWEVREFLHQHGRCTFTAVNDRAAQPRISQVEDEQFPFFTHRDEHVKQGDCEDAYYHVHRSFVPHVGGRYGVPRYGAFAGGPALHAIDPEHILNRRLGSHAKIRVTVEVLYSGTEPDRRSADDRREVDRRVGG